MPRFKYLFTLRLPSSPRPGPSIRDIPSDVVLEIGRHISSRADVLNFSLVVFIVVTNGNLTNISLGISASGRESH